MLLQFVYSTLTAGLSFLLIPVFLLKERGRVRLWERFGLWGSIAPEVVWFHGASVGEVQALLPLIRKWKEQFPEHKVLLTSTSATGLNCAKEDVHYRRLLPFDSYPWLWLALRGVTVHRLIFGETEVWPALLSLLANRGVPLHLVNGVMTEKTYKTYSKVRFFLSSLFSSFSSLSASDEQSLSRFRKLGVSRERSFYAGNIKYDRPRGIASKEDGEKKAKSFFHEHREVVVLGSVHPEEFELLLSGLKEYLDRLSFIVAPRHSEKFDHFASRLQEEGVSFTRRSEGISSPHSVVLLDTLGELESVYSFSSLAFVGGTLVPLGGHNPLEPASYGVPIIVGPHQHKIIHLIEGLKEERALCEIQTTADFKHVLQKYLESPDEFAEFGKKAHKVWKDNQGACERVVHTILEAPKTSHIHPPSFGLFLLSKLYGVATSFRNKAFDYGLLKQTKSALPVICIGNLTAGGNGKTPLCEYIVTQLQSLDKKPAILSRGYGGSTPGPYIVKETDSATLVGDEPLMLHRKCKTPVVVSRSRVAGARLIEQQELGDVVVLDDGYQHRYLRRDLNIITVDISSEGAAESFLKGELIPLGRFRESKEEGLNRADIVVLAYRGVRTEDGQVRASRIRESLPEHLPVFESYLSLQGIVSLSGNETLSPQKVVAVCGIANPEGFFSLLSQSGYDCVATKVLGDHQRISQSDLEQLSQYNLPIVCTEKDAVKLPGGSQVYVTRVGGEIDDSEEFLELLKVI